jgi:hypothetical protein
VQHWPLPRVLIVNNDIGAIYVVKIAAGANCTTCHQGFALWFGTSAQLGDWSEHDPSLHVVSVHPMCGPYRVLVKVEQVMIYQLFPLNELLP